MSSSSMSNSYAIGNVSIPSNSAPGGSGVLLGYHGDLAGKQGTISNSYYNSVATVTGRPKTYGTAASLANFKTLSWYTASGRWSTTDGNTAWDFTNVWNAPVSNVNNGYPTLRLK